jgi:nucleotide-binding universal stress UspA family protein
MMSRHILVPLDGSQLAERALEEAERLINPDDTLTLLTVVPVPEIPIYDFYPMPMSVVQDYEAGMSDALPYAQEYLERIAAQLRETLNVTVNVVVELGEPPTVIAATAEKYHVDMIVMSTHGRSGLNRWLFGSVTFKVLSNACCPVVVIPNRGKVREPSAAQAEANV